MNARPAFLGRLELARPAYFLKWKMPCLNACHRIKKGRQFAHEEAFSGLFDSGDSGRG